MIPINSLHYKHGSRRGTRTPNRSGRNRLLYPIELCDLNYFYTQTLYPVELRGHILFKNFNIID